MSFREAPIAALAAGVGLVAATAASAQSGTNLSELDLDNVEVRNYVITPNGPTKQPFVFDVNRSDCPQEFSTHSSANFGSPDPIQVGLQGGIVEGEIFAAEYQLADEAFPIRLDQIRSLWVTNQTTQVTTTFYTVLIWEGNPETGTLIASFSAEDPNVNPAAPPPLVMDPGTGGVLLTFQIDPNAAPDDQIFIGEGSPPPGNSFSVGFRIDQHNNQFGSGCLFPPPQASNAFPSTDTINPNQANQRTRNWLFAIDCGFGGFAPAGWNRFSQLASFGVEPGGDWNLDVLWTSFNPNCGTLPVGCCCLDGGGTFPNVDENLCVSAGGTWAGINTDCADPNVCASGCDQDVAGDDGLINADDLLAVLGSFGAATSTGDATGDGLVNADDLLAILGAFGQSCSDL